LANPRINDKRYLPRWAVRNRVFYKLEQDPRTREGHTRDLSCSGARVRTNSSLEPHQKIHMTIRLNEETVVSLHGYIVWLRVIADETEMGVNFINTSPQTQEVILQHAFEVNRDQVKTHWFDGWDGQKDSSSDKTSQEPSS